MDADGEFPADDASDGGRDSGSNVMPSYLLRDAAPADAGIVQTEPPLIVPDCEDVSGALCCPSALGFEDGSTEHFLPPTCCRMALSKPQVVAAPTACGRGALRLDADFRATTAASMCGEVGEELACSYQTGEVSRPVLTSLNITGLTLSAAIYLDGPPLPEGPVDAQLFILTGDGVIEGPLAPLGATGIWTGVELPIAGDGNAGAGVRLIGLRISFHGQAWAGRTYVDEVTWH
jgi:hypothetical protein